MEFQETNPEDLQKSLNEGVVKFAFKKVGGSLRIALGTRSLNQIPLAKHPKGGREVESTIPYYDLEKGAWRCANKNQDFCCLFHWHNLSKSHFLSTYKKIIN